MAIVRMKRLRLFAMAEDRERLLDRLAHLGVVEISEAESAGEAAETAASEKLGETLSQIVSAQSSARKHSKLKKGLFSPRPEMTEQELLSSELLSEAEEITAAINEREAALSRLYAERSRIATLRKTYAPWEKLDVPLDTGSGRFYETTLMTVPSVIKPEDIAAAVAEGSEYAEPFVVSSDRELHYLFLISHSGDAERVREKLKQLGAAVVKFSGTEVTAREKIKALDAELLAVENEIKEAEENIAVTVEQYDKLLAAQDAVESRIAVADAAEKGITTARAFYLEGWCPAREEKMLSEVFEESGYAYEFSDPAEGEEPPTLTYNSKLISPFNMITNMYSPPAYTGIDPNPTMAPFFALFFGIMLSDAGYGLLLMFAGIFALWKLKPRGGFRSFMQLAVICGASTVVWGLLFGGFFGDAIPSVYLLFTGKTFPYDLALWFNPTNDPMTMLIFSLVLGGVQIVAGMAVKGYMMIRDGLWLDALFDIGFWWVVFGGAITCIFNAQLGLYVLAAGALGLILTQGRAKKNIIMKFFSGLLSLYDITGYFSDILSYSRLLALSLATAVVGNVINTMGVITGPVCFFLVFIIGHLFNIAINLVGSFVHSARLQYVEYFGKFYESGGRLFAPLTIKSKNTDIIKEEN